MKTRIKEIPLSAETINRYKKSGIDLDESTYIKDGLKVKVTEYSNGIVKETNLSK